MRQCKTFTYSQNLFKRGQGLEEKKVFGCLQKTFSCIEYQPHANSFCFFQLCHKKCNFISFLVLRFYSKQRNKVYTNPKIGKNVNYL